MKYLSEHLLFLKTYYEIKELGSNKYDFLIKNFPFLDPMNFVFVGNKSILKSDIKIDDKIENLVNGDIKILFTAYHNKNISDEELKNQGIIRAKDWLDIKKILLESGEE